MQESERLGRYGDVMDSSSYKTDVCDCSIDWAIPKIVPLGGFFFFFFWPVRIDIQHIMLHFLIEDHIIMVTPPSDLLGSHKCIQNYMDYYL